MFTPLGFENSNQYRCKATRPKELNRDMNGKTIGISSNFGGRSSRREIEIVTFHTARPLSSPVTNRTPACSGVWWQTDEPSEIGWSDGEPRLCLRHQQDANLFAPACLPRRRAQWLWPALQRPPPLSPPRVGLGEETLAPRTVCLLERLSRHFPRWDSEGRRPYLPVQPSPSSIHQSS